MAPSRHCDVVPLGRVIHSSAQPFSCNSTSPSARPLSVSAYSTRTPGGDAGPAPRVGRGGGFAPIIAAVRQAAGPVMAREVGEVVGVDVSVRAKLEPLRSKLVRLVDRGWLRKLPDGRFTTRLGPAALPLRAARHGRNRGAPGGRWNCVTNTKELAEDSGPLVYQCGMPL